MEKEIRQINTPAKIEKRADGGIGSIVGYPIVYNKDSEDMGFIERIAPGAAKKALKRSDIRGLKNHDPSLIFARQGVNLTFKEDKDGLSYVASPIDTQNYRETAKEVEAGLLTGQSFGFTILADEWKDLDTDKPKRTITEIGEIFDVGPVTYPAYQDTSVALRSLAKAKESNDKPAFKYVADTIDIVLKRDDGNDLTYSFENKEVFDEFMSEAVKRSSANPTIPADDITDPDPTIIPDSDLAKDDTLDKINATIERLRK